MKLDARPPSGLGEQGYHPQKPGGKRRAPRLCTAALSPLGGRGPHLPGPGGLLGSDILQGRPHSPYWKIPPLGASNRISTESQCPREPVNPPQSGDGQSPPPRGSNGTGETTQELHRMGAECPEHSVFTGPGWPGEKPGSLGEGQRVPGNCAQHGHAIRGWLTAVHAAVGPANARFSIPRLRSPKSNFLLPGKGDRGPSR